MSSRLTLKDLFANMPAKAESLLSQLTPEQILLIEDTISRIKRRKTDHDNNNNNNDTIKKNNNASVTITTKINESNNKKTNATMTPTATATTTKKVMTNEQENQSTATATAIANALASAMTTAALQQAPSSSTTSNPSSSQTTPPVSACTKSDVAIAPTVRQEPVAEVRDGVEWVSFVYSHNRTLKRYNIRTDIHTVDLQAIDQKFKEDNCVSNLNKKNISPTRALSGRSDPESHNSAAKALFALNLPRVKAE